MLAAAAIIAGLCFIAMIFLALGTDGVADPASATSAYQFLREMPGEIDYYHTNTTTIWPIDGTGDDKPYPVYSPLDCVDVDMDGTDEVVFGLATGYLVVVDIDHPEESRELDFPGSEYYSIEVGNVDSDPSMEIVFKADHPTKLCCVDYTDWEIQWNFSEIGEVDYFFLFDDDGDGVHGIFVVADESYARIDGDGRIVYNGTLDIFNQSLSSTYRHVICDHDGDGDEEVLLFTLGYDMFWGRNGKHLWVIDLLTGEIEYARRYDELVFASAPLLFEWNGERYVAVGLMSYYGYDWEMFVLDVATKKYELFNYSGTFGWNYYNLMMLPTDNGPLFIISVPGGCHIGWSYTTRSVVWTTGVKGYIDGFYSSFLCDIDGDSAYEIISDPLVVIDALTGKVEVNGSRSLHIAAGDPDGDNLSELCFAEYVSIEGGKKYQRVVIIDTPQYFDWGADVEGGTQQLFAGIESELAFKVEGMMESRVPAKALLNISNRAWGHYLTAHVDLLNDTVEPCGTRAIRILSGVVAHSITGPSIRLRLVPDWTFSHDGPNDIHLLFDDWKGRPQDCVAVGAFRVERDLAIVGELRMRTAKGPITRDTWVAGDTNVVIDGFDVVYEGTTDLRPDRNAFTVIARVGDVELERSFTEEWPLGVAFTVPRVSGQVPVVVSVNLSFAEVHSVNALSTTVSVDCWPPMVLEPGELGKWYSSSPVTVVVRFSEPEAGMNHWGLRYTVVKSRDDEPTRWFVPYEDEFGKVDGAMGGYGTHWVRLRLYPPDGLSYLLVEATDVLGNSRRHWLTVRLDLTVPRVTVEAPTGWCRTDRVRVTARFEDIDGSGIDPDSVQVAFAYDDPPLFADWVPARTSGLGERVNASAFIPAIQGKLNHAKFRARDFMDHAVYSDHVTVWVDSVYPYVTLADPLDGTVLDPPWTDLNWSLTVREGGSGLEPLEVSLIELGTGIELEAAVTIEEGQSGVFNVTVRWAPTKGTGCRLDVKATDRAGNVFVSPHWKVHINSPPEVRILTPRDNSLVAQGAAVRFDADVWDRQTRTANLTCEWSLDGLPWVWGVSTFEKASLPIGTHCVRLEVSDGFYRVGANVTITVFEPPEGVVEDEPPEEAIAPGRSLDAVIVAACLAAIVALFAYRRHKRF